jgi:pimeloyl-ACP methyl ester carboxylesterase
MLAAACRQVELHVAWHDPAPHRSAFAQVNGVRLNYLDWGGEGPPLVLIHGFGDSPHVFDDLALRLRSQFHVIAYARRGHGSSDAPAGPYDGATLVEDLRQLLDALGVARTSLLGWSVGGNEITGFAGLYPDRVDKLIYLDAGYDWSDATFLRTFSAILATNSPDAPDLHSLDAFRAWFRSVWLGAETAWTPGLEAYLRDATRVGRDGQVHMVPPREIAAALFAALATAPREYRKVQAPALALYASDFFPPQPKDHPMNVRVQEFEDFMSVFRRYSMERMCREMPHVTVKFFTDRNHMSSGLRDPDRLASEIGSFLSAPASTL